jgi:hypothetical protein
MLASKAVKSEWAAPYPNAAHWVSTARMTGGKKVAARLWASLQLTQSREGLKDSKYLFTSSNVSKAEILITIFIQLLSQPHL